MSDDAVAIARASYERCCEAPEFFASFYEHFFAACPAAKPMFAKTDFTRQHKLLRHAIGLLFTYARQPDTQPNLLARVAERHSRSGIGVDPALYPVFLDSLIATARRFDPQFTEGTAAAWRVATAQGIAYMQSRF